MCRQADEMYSSEGKILFDALATSYEFVQIDKFFFHEIKWSTIVSKPIPPPEMAIWGSLVLKCLFY
jgi:hypothetical protein